MYNYIDEQATNGDKKRGHLPTMSGSALDVPSAMASTSMKDNNIRNTEQTVSSTGVKHDRSVASGIDGNNTPNQAYV